MKKTVKLPKRKATLAGKLVDDNPWEIGDDLAAAICEDWDALNEAYLSPEATSDHSSHGTPVAFAYLMSELPALKEVCRKNHLAPFHVAMTIIKNYM